MEAAFCVAPRNDTRHTPEDFYSKGHKRIKLSHDIAKPSKTGSSNVVDYSDPFAVSHMIETLDSGIYGSVTEDMKALLTFKLQVLSPYLQKHPSLSDILWGGEKSSTKGGSGVQPDDVIDLDDDDDVGHNPMVKNAIVVIDSDDEDKQDQRMVLPFQEVALPKPEGQFVTEKEFDDLQIENKRRGVPQMVPVELGGKKKPDPKDEPDIKKDKGTYIGVADDDNDSETVDDGLGDIWNEMSLAMECAKEDVEHHPSDDYMEDDDELCDHSFILKDDIGYVCRICGVIERGIESIIEVQFYKAKKSTRTYMSSRTEKDRDQKEAIGIQLSEEDMMVTEIAAHPRHLKVMKPHQIEGFNFLCSNLVSENPGGCILAHAPGSGKTFMIISFMQSFLAKYPHARPLVVLPKGILSTWKTEFKRWEVENIPLLDFYTMKADSRHQQLDILKQWLEEKSILFLGYKQFSSIICDSGSSVATSCQEILLKRPSILILDEGHTPRNENTDVLQSLAKIQTPRKVVLSGTLYQNHVKEVFNILNLARPKFLRLDSSKGIVKRIMSKVNISGLKKQIKVGADATFFELVEHTIQKDPDFNRKVSIIRDLREMTSKVLHYYKGDFLDELPGLADFTVVLNLSYRQKHEVKELKKLARKFKRSSVGSAVYLHPKLITVSESVGVTDGKMDELLETLNLRDGAKAKFFFNMLGLCESTGEKLLVFSQYLTPLKFLERLVVNVKGWTMGKEIFVISGESSSDQREWSMNQFNKSPDAKVFFGSIKACGEGISLVGASRILILDVHLNPSVTRQAIGRAFRPGQTKKVYAYRLVAADSPEEEDHSACFRKEAIAKMWFEWHEYCGYQNFEVEKIELEESDDPFLESPLLREDIRVLYRR